MPSSSEPDRKATPNSSAGISFYQIRREWRSRILADEDEGGRQIPPNHFALNRAEISLEHLLQIEPLHVPVVHYLHAVDILILREHALLAQKTAHTAKKTAALHRGHQAERERRNDAVDLGVPTCLQFFAKPLRADIDKGQTRIRNRGLQVARKSGIDLEGEKSCVEREPVKQRARDHARPRPYFNHNPRSFQGQRAKHGVGQMARTRRDRANGAEIGQSLLRKGCQVRLRRLFLSAPAENVSLSAESTSEHLQKT
jgi:hypothetical protein